ncbi:MAG: hypothetical protein M3N21_08320, partial [Actinomycetota bacterium]|nr:hypothetical protein [Actinomycetota bacterium]
MLLTVPLALSACGTTVPTASLAGGQQGLAPGSGTAGVSLGANGAPLSGSGLSGGGLSGAGAAGPALA